MTPPAMENDDVSTKLRAAGATSNGAAPVTAGEGRDPNRATLAWKFAQAHVRMIATLVFDLQVFGLHHIPRTGGVLMLTNHQSLLDPPLIGARLRRPMAYLAKSELFEFKPFGAAIRSVNAFPVKQGKGDVGAMKESIRLLRAGWMLNVFPEGTRTPDGTLQPAQKGVGLMIKRAPVPVLPTVIDGTFHAWPRGAKWPRPCPVRILHGPPADISHLKADDIRKWIDDTFARMLDDLRSGRV